MSGQADQKKSTCDKCGAGFDSQEELDRHVKSEHEQKKQKQETK